MPVKSGADIDYSAGNRFARQGIQRVYSVQKGLTDIFQLQICAVRIKKSRCSGHHRGSHGEEGERSVWFEGGTPAERILFATTRHSVLRGAGLAVVSIMEGEDAVSPGMGRGRAECGHARRLAGGRGKRVRGDSRHAGHARGRVHRHRAQKHFAPSKGE